MSLKHFLFTALLTFAMPLYAEEARVVRVLDGDTVEVQWEDLSTSRIRMAGIDAPEHDQTAGEECKSLLERETLGKTVSVEAYAGQITYGRQVATLFYKNKNINLNQLKKGCAWVYKQYLKTLPKEYWGDYLRAEIQARKQRLGLWQEENPMNPADFRHSK